MLPLLRDLAERAERDLDPRWHDYLDTGAGEEISLHEAEAAWQAYRLRPRVLRAAGEVGTAARILGTRVETPVAVAPTAYHRMFHEAGEVATAAGAAAAGALMIVSTRATMPLADIAAAAGPWWLQVYLTRERAAIENLVTAAAELGASAIVLTGDTPIVSTRSRGRGSVAAMPPEWHLTNLGRAVPEGVDPVWAVDADPAASLDDIQRLAELSGLPVLVKGVLRGDDALACLDAGAAGIVVSNHGGRQLDRAIATAVALPEVVTAVGGQAPVLVDGGIRSGMDALVALALGADAVLLGRPVVWGLAAAGAAGVQTVLDGVTSDLRESLALFGVASPGGLDADDVTGRR
ncbi:alpha-hydroxy acid oxidase [Pseudactinotalea sp.]|uniref:alpha-hydroxy acid oxidase n=1 Tax=Pseudactinotalea sp. TaxID=1926260 RepID=UPI003B3B2EC0